MHSLDEQTDGRTNFWRGRFAPKKPNLELLHLLDIDIDDLLLDLDLLDAQPLDVV